MNDIFDFIEAKTEKKKCGGCQEWKILDEFYNCKAKSSGKQRSCKICDKKRIIDKYENNTEKRREYQREYYNKIKNDPEIKQKIQKTNRNLYRSINHKEFNKNKELIKSDMIDDVGYVYCERCKVSSESCYHTHHIVYRSEASKHENLDNRRNLIILCTKCHGWMHRSKEANRKELVNKRKLWELFPTFLYLRP